MVCLPKWKIYFIIFHVYLLLMQMTRIFLYQRNMTLGIREFSMIFPVLQQWKSSEMRNLSVGQLVKVVSQWVSHSDRPSVSQSLFVRQGGRQYWEEDRRVVAGSALLSRPRIIRWGSFSPPFLGRAPKPYGSLPRLVPFPSSPSSCFISCHSLFSCHFCNWENDLCQSFLTLFFYFHCRLPSSPRSMIFKI